MPAQSPSSQKTRAFRPLRPVAGSTQRADVGHRHTVEIGQRAVLRDRHDRLERLVDAEAERRHIGAHAVLVDAERRAKLRDREGLSELARHRVALIRAERRACNEARDEREPKTDPSLHRDLAILPFSAGSGRMLDLISRRNAAEAAALFGLLAFLAVLAFAFVAFDAGRRADAPQIYLTGDLRK